MEPGWPICPKMGPPWTSCILGHPSTQVEIEIKQSSKLRSWVCIQTQDLNLQDCLISIWTSVKCGDFAAVIAICYSQAAKQPLLSHVGIRVKVITFKNDQQVSRIRCFAWPDPWTIVIMKQNCNNAGHRWAGTDFNINFCLRLGYLQFGMGIASE